jgi:GNAT superfamily N-acetyltransferase
MSAQSQGAYAPRPNFKVPIRALTAEQRPAIAEHLLQLGPRDRYLRFGYAANDDHIRRYVAALDFARDEVFGIFNRQLRLIAMAHLAYLAPHEQAHEQAHEPAHEPAQAQETPRVPQGLAEFGVSVNHHARGRGYGMQLFRRAVVHARNHGVDQLFIHALTENMAMLAIARKGGATVVQDGSESQAHLRLPPADFESQVSEMLDEQLARTDYHFKAQTRYPRYLWYLLRRALGLPDRRDKDTRPV